MSSRFRLRVDLEEGALSRAALATDALDVDVGGAALMVDLARAVKWSRCNPREGSPIAVRIRSVGLRSKAACSDAITQSRFGEHLVGQRERAVDPDVHLDPFQDFETARAAR